MKREASSTNSTAEFKAGKRVTYVPYHAHGDRNHPDCESGEVSSTNDTYVFVRFVRNGVFQSTAQACRPDQLVFG